MRALALLVLFTPAIAHAELEEKGLRAGTVIMAIQNDDVDGNNQTSVSLISNPGWTAGAWLTWRQSDSFAFQLETSISNKRVRSEECSPCMDTGDLSFYYLEVPFVLRLDLLPNATKLFLAGGPEAVLGLGGGRTPPGGEFERDDDIIGVNLGVFGGLGFAIPAGPGKIALDVRYKRWLFPIKSEDMGPSGSGDELELRRLKPSHQLSVTVGYAFP